MPPRSVTVDELLVAADADGLERRFEDAARRYLEVTMRAPERAEGHVGLARALVELGKLEGVIPSLFAAAEADPGFLPTYGLAARVGLHFHRPHAVLPVLEAGALAHPLRPEVFVWLARIQAAAGRLAGVRDALRHLERLTRAPREELVRALSEDPDVDEATRDALLRAGHMKLA